MKILVACEESQAVTKELRSLGHEAYSNDMVEPSGDNPEWHIIGDCIELMYDKSKKWDMVIAFPPCTYLAVSGARWLYNKDGSKNTDRWAKRKDALDFIMKIMDAPVDKIAIENPVGAISSQIRKPDQILRPFNFGHSSTKKTCIWLKGLDRLQDTETVDVEYHYTKTGVKYDKWWFDTCLISNLKERAKVRSKTFKGIAKAMAEQWGGVCEAIEAERD